MRAILLLGSLMCVLVAETSADEITIPQHILCPGTLLKVKVVQLGGTRTAQEATLAVTRVFCVHTNAAGTRFVVAGPRSGASTNLAPSMLPAYKVG
jgi:hypothetical protein